MSRYELVDWTPSKCPPILLHQNTRKRSRKNLAFLTNMHLRKVGTKYIHNGGKP